MVSGKLHRGPNTQAPPLLPTQRFPPSLSALVASASPSNTLFFLPSPLHQGTKELQLFFYFFGEGAHLVVFRGLFQSCLGVGGRTGISSMKGTLPLCYLSGPHLKISKVARKVVQKFRHGLGMEPTPVRSPTLRARRITLGPALSRAGSHS